MANQTEKGCEDPRTSAVERNVGSTDRKFHAVSPLKPYPYLAVATQRSGGDQPSELLLLVGRAQLSSLSSGGRAGARAAAVVRAGDRATRRPLRRVKRRPRQARYGHGQQGRRAARARACFSLLRVIFVTPGCFGSISRQEKQVCEGTASRCA